MANRNGPPTFKRNQKKDGEHNEKAQKGGGQKNISFHAAMGRLNKNPEKVKENVFGTGLVASAEKKNPRRNLEKKTPKYVTKVQG